MISGRAGPPRAIGIWLFLAGIGMTFGFAPFGLWPLAVASLAVLLAAVREAHSARQAMGAALVWGMGHGITALYWLPWAFYKDSDGDWMAAVFGGGAAVLGLALYGALGYMLAAWAGFRAGRYWGPLAFIAVMILEEMVKSTTPYGFPWLPVGAVWASWAPMMQLASLGGVYLLSALVLLLAVLVSVPTRARLAMAAALAMTVAAYGELRLLRAPMADGNKMIRVVQPNIQSAFKWDANLRWAFLQDTLDLATSGSAVPPTLVLPETAVAFYLDRESSVRQAMAERIGTAGAFVTGTVRREDVDGQSMPHFYNVIAVLRHDARIHDAYDKMLLVPFGEFIPLRGLLEKLPLPVALRTLSQSRLDYSFGQASPLLSTPAGEAVGLICYEGIFPWHVARYARHADYLINITNDSWFTGTIALYQHASLARLRAVETGLPLVRSANTGLSIVFDGYGRVVARLPVNRAAAMDINLPKSAGTTPFGIVSGVLSSYLRL